MISQDFFNFEGINIFLLFHLAIPLLIFEIPYFKNRFRVNRFSLIIGSLYPDIVDKALLFLELGSGRGYAHTLLFVLISFIILFLVSKGNKPIALPFLIGCLFHLLLDMPYIPIFYPFVFYEFIELDNPIEFWLDALFTNPIIITTEIIGGIIFVFIVLNNKLYRISAIVNYLKTNPQNTIKKTNKIEKNNINIEKHNKLY